MPHISVPAAELNTRLDRLRCAMTEKDPAWSMLLLDNTLDMYYFTGTMQDGALVVTPDQATLFVRRSFDVAKDESAFADIPSDGQFPRHQGGLSGYSGDRLRCRKDHDAAKALLLNKHLPFATKPMDGVLSALRSVKSAYELDCMRESGKLHRYVIEGLAPAFLREGVSEARLCSEICTAIVDRGGMGISRYNQPAAEDVLGIASFSENSLRPTALDSPSGCIGTSTAMKSIGSSERTLHEGDTVLLDIPCGWRGYHTDKSITFYYGELDKHPQSGVIRAAREQCIALENETASLLRAGAIPAEIYEKILSLVDPAFREGFMNGCKFLGHSIGLTMDETPVLAKGFSAPLESGMTLAVEPKIAIPGVGLIGCENTYEITADGPAQSLTGACDTLFEVLNQ